MIEKLPQELLHLVVAELSDDSFSILQLSMTCKACRSMLAPTLFRSIYLQSTPKSAASVERIARSRLSNYVKELHFQGRITTLEGNDPTPEERKWLHPDKESEASKDNNHMDDPNLLPSSARDVLSNLDLFPELETLSVEFFFTHEAFYDALMDLMAEAEDPRLIDQYEAESSWRALMAKTWNAVARNQKGVKRLEARRLHIRQVSTFMSEAWHRFLNGVQEFQLSTWGGENGVGWHLSKVAEYPVFMGKLDEFFYNHLHSVANLAVLADYSGVIGDTPEWRITPLCLKPNHIPLLQTVHLEWVLLCQDLTEFLEHHTETLISITLHDCLALGLVTVRDPMTWSMFFDALDRMQSRKLRHLQVSWTKSPTFYKVTREDMEGMKIKCMESPRAIFFPYTQWDEKYGNFLLDKELSPEKFLLGEDQTSYDRLMTRVRKNAYRVFQEGSSEAESGFDEEGSDGMAEPDSVGMIPPSLDKDGVAPTPIAKTKASFAPDEFNPRFKERSEGRCPAWVPNLDPHLSREQTARAKALAPPRKRRS